jgi:arylsulfatase A-like enzyme
MLHAHTRTGLGWDVDDRTLQELRTLYQAATRQVDDSIGRVLDSLSANGLDDETAVVLAGDHGEEFQDHGHLAHYPKLYDELIRVPLIVDVPGVDGGRVEGQVGLDAIPPTVTDLLDVDAPEMWTGASLVPAAVDGEAPADEPTVSVAVRGEEVTTQPIPRSLDDGDLLVSVRDRDWTYIRNLATDDEELYHRPTDAGQTVDRSAELDRAARAVVDRYRPVTDAHAELLRSGKSGADPAPEVDADLGARLEALGYR